MLKLIFVVQILSALSEHASQSERYAPQLLLQGLPTWHHARGHLESDFDTYSKWYCMHGRRRFVWYINLQSLFLDILTSIFSANSSSLRSAIFLEHCVSRPCGFLPADQLHFASGVLGLKIQCKQNQHCGTRAGNECLGLVRVRGALGKQLIEWVQIRRGECQWVATRKRRIGWSMMITCFCMSLRPNLEEVLMDSMLTHLATASSWINFVSSISLPLHQRRRRHWIPVYVICLSPLFVKSMCALVCFGTNFLAARETSWSSSALLLWFVFSFQ